MTAEEKEIRDAERKAMAEVRRWKRNVSKKLASMTPEERQEYWRKGAEELKAKGYNVVYSLNGEEHTF